MTQAYAIPIEDDLERLRDKFGDYCPAGSLRFEAVGQGVILVGITAPMVRSSNYPVEIFHPGLVAEIQMLGRIEEGSIPSGSLAILIRSGRKVYIKLTPGKSEATAVQGHCTPSAAEVKASLDAALPVAYRSPPAPTAMGHLAEPQVEELTQPPLL